MKLRYKIRFQNTGTAPANLVIVKDQLPANVNPSTFHFIGSSHAGSVVQNGSNVSFNFPNINLPDSSTAPAESQGWIEFEVESRSMRRGDGINNVADIYFDDNEPVRTNTADFSIPPLEVPLALGYPLRLNAVLYDDQVRLTWKNEGSTNAYHRYLLSRSADGRNYQPLTEVPVSGNRLDYTHTDWQPLLGKNFYRVEEKDDQNHVWATAFAVVNQKSKLYTVSIAPNPADDRVVISYHLVNAEPTTIDILDATGRSVVHHNLTDETGQVCLTTSNWAKGLYLFVVICRMVKSSTNA